MTTEEAALLVAQALALHPKYQNSDLTLTATIWQRLLSDIPYPLAQAALDRVLAVSPYWPTPAQIREAAERLAPEPDAPPPAEIAWEEVRKKLSPYGAIQWSHPLIEKAVGIIGRLTLCSAEYDLSRRFMDTYQALVNRNHDEKINQVVVRIQGGQIAIAIPGQEPKKIGGQHQ